MLTKIKKFFLSFFILNKKTVPVLLFFILLGVLLPFHFAHAFIEALAAAIIGFLTFKKLLIPAALSFIFLEFTRTLLAHVTGPAFFLGISYTANPFVNLGWTLTRDLANMFFILVLVVIALATILRIEDYQAKKALPLLIIIALLINFTPVIAGIIIDFFNILMRFFLGEGISFDSLLVGIRILGAGIMHNIRALNPFAATIEIIITIALAPLILLIFNLLTGFIFLILAFLFVIRPIALMMLVILSPIAFLAYILPATRSYWTQWWSQFIAWCLVGVTASFFLYLTNMLSHMIFQQAWGGFFRGTGAERVEGGILVAFIPVLIVLGFLVMGLIYAMTTSAAGASHVIGAAKGAGRWAGKALAVKAGVVAAREYPKWFHAAERFGDKWRQEGEKKGGLMGYAQRTIGTAIERGASPLAIKGETMALKEGTEIEDTYRKAGQEQRNIVLVSGSNRKKVHALRSSIAEGDVEKAIKAIKEGKTEEQFKKELSSIHKTAKDMELGLETDIERSLPHFYKEFGKQEDSLDELTKKIGSRPELAKNMSLEAWKSDILKPYLTKNLQGNLHQILRVADQEAQKTIVDAYQEIIDKEGEEERGFEKLTREYTQASRYFNSNAAKDLGVGLNTKLSEEKIQEIIKRRGAFNLSEKEISVKAEEIWKKTGRTDKDANWFEARKELINKEIDRRVKKSGINRIEAEKQVTEELKQ